MIEKKSTADVQKTNCEMEKPRNQEKEFVLYLIKENQEKIPSGIFFSAMIEKKSTADVQKTNCEMEKPRNQEKEFVLYLYHNKT